MRLLATLTFLALPFVTFAADWPQFRGPLGDGHVTGDKLPLHWDGEKNVAWKTTLPGKGWSSPVLGGDRIYLTTAVAESGQEDAEKTPRSLRALCLNAADGAIVWDVEVFRQDSAWAPRIHNKNSHASPTPVLDGDRLYVHFGHQGTACLDLSGKKIWEQRSLRYQPVHGGGGSPVLHNGLLIFPADGASEPFIAALKAKDGRVAWKTARQPGEKKTFSFATPALLTRDGESQVLSPASGGLFAYNPDTGKELWHIRYENGYSVIPKPVIGNGLVYYSSGYDDPVTYAITPAAPGETGDLTATHVKWSESKRAPNTPSMILDGENLFTVADNGIASCLNALTGEIYWQERTARACSASPLLHGGHLYILDEFGTTTILEAARTFRKVATNTLPDAATLASPAAADGTLYLRTDKALYCIRENG